jgi:hypothetical protein
MVPQVKVKWSGLPSSCNTREPLYALVNAFPSAPAWGQVGSSGGGNFTDVYLTKALHKKRRTARRQAIRERQQLKKGTHQATRHHT